jgi:hypothetical protein
MAIITSITLTTFLLAALMTINNASHPFVYQDMSVNPFMVNINRKISMQPSRNMLGVTVQVQIGFDNVPSFLKDENMPMLIAIESFKLRLFRSKSPPITDTALLSANGELVATNHFEYLGLVMNYFFTRHRSGIFVPG